MDRQCTTAITLLTHALALSLLQAWSPCIVQLDCIPYKILEYVHSVCTVLL